MNEIKLLTQQQLQINIPRENKDNNGKKNDKQQCNKVRV